MKSVIFLSTQTSANGSIKRIANLVLKAGLGMRLNVEYYDKLRKRPRPEIMASVPPQDGQFIYINFPPNFNTLIDLSKYRYFVNFRDPRDRLCNVFHWQMVHPTNETEEAWRARVEKVQQAGINQWVERHTKSDGSIRYYDNLFWLLENAPASDRTVLTYARLCCDFDSFTESLCAFLGVELDEEIRAALEPERVENLGANSRWIGNKWSGSDTLPGRYKRELDPQCIERLSRHFEPVLRKMAKHDPDYAEQYLEWLT